MRELIGAHIKEASLRRTAPVIAEKTEPRGDAQPIAFARAPLASHADPVPTASAHSHMTVGSSDPIQPVMVKTISYRTAPTQTSLAPLPNLVPVAAAPSPPPAASAAVRALPAAPAAEAPSTIVVASNELAAIATMGKAEPAKLDPVKPDPVKSEPAKPAPAPPQVRVHGGWLIQIGAFDGEDEAKQHLSAAQFKAPTMLAAADPFTERVQKGDKALYRARFAGFDKAMAEAACKQLKRSDIECMTVKN